MSKKKKRKPIKTVNPETWKNVKLGLSTLISNDGCIQAARTFHGPADLIPIGLTLVAVVLAVLPTFVSQMNAKQSSYIFGSASANYEAGLAEFSQSLVYDDHGVKRDTPLSLSINDEGTAYQISDADLAALNNGANWYTVTRTTDAGTKPVFEVYFNNTDYSDADFISLINAYKDPWNEGKTRDASGTIAEYQCSYLAFGKEGITFRKRTESSSFTGLTGVYKRLAGYNLTTIAKELSDAGHHATSKIYLNRMHDEFVKIIDDSTLDAKIGAVWAYVGIFAGVDMGLIVLFGAILFLMTRGKNNPFRVINFWETQKMSYWACFTPSLLAMILGFFMSQYAMLFFMFAFGMRMMWMSMRSMRPQA